MEKQRQPSDGEIAKSRSMVREIIAHHFGSSKAATRYLEGGRTNFVFDVRHRHGRFVVRINSEAHKLESFLKEQWAVARVRKLDVPAPEILEVANDLVDWPYMISLRAVGSEATFHPKRAAVVRETGRYAAVINSVRTRGFGETFDWSRNKLSTNTSWHNFVEQELDLGFRLATLQKHNLISPSQSDKVRSTLQNAAKRAKHPVLNHGDLRLKNVLVDKRGEITAIVDWEHCVSSFAAWDLSIALHDLGIDEKEQFLLGYGISEATLLKVSPLIKALNIINYAPAVLLGNARKQRSNALKTLRVRLSGSLDLYSL